jgi:phage shock protein PspC (stress-responsive transcriptional regulator)
MQPPADQGFHRGTDRIIGGVCSGLAEGFHVEALWVRLAFVVLAFVQGIGIVLYVVLWFLMPERAGSRPAGQPAFESMKNDIRRAWADLQAQFGSSRSTTPSAASATVSPTPDATVDASASVETAPAPPAPPHATTRNPSYILGAIFIAIGIAFLFANSHLVDWSVIWPAALVVLGIALLVRNLNRKSGQ